MTEENEDSGSGEKPAPSTPAWDMLNTLSGGTEGLTESERKLVQDLVRHLSRLTQRWTAKQKERQVSDSQSYRLVKVVACSFAVALTFYQQQFERQDRNEGDGP